MSDQETVISTHELTKRYGNKTALNGLSIELKRGHIYGLVGNNGSGKTTLMRVLTGLSPRYEGKVEILGRSDKKGLRLSQKSMGAVVGAPKYYDMFSIKGNLTMHGLLIGKNDSEEIKSLREQLRLKNRDIGGRTMRSCSLSQKQLSGVAAALLGGPELLVLDEPLDGLDTNGIEDSKALLLKANRENGATILISSHEPADLDNFATDYIFIEKGKLVEQLSTEELEARMAERGMESVEEYFRAIVPSEPGKESAK
ncbi:MAG: ATP-binding cassette domain-containing protein [Oscillospiraceae bacterium]|nr:ATP-binding cassette domain-containing protein [Oscillospiraceae bacterium]